MQRQIDELDKEVAQQKEWKKEVQGNSIEVRRFTHIITFYKQDMTELTNQYLHYDKMETDVLKSKKKEVVAETASSSESKNGSENLAAESDGPRCEEVEDSVSILRSKAQGRVFPGSS